MCTKAKIIRSVTAAAYIALAIWVASAAIMICRDGMAVRESGDILAAVYTREIVAKHLAPMIPLFFVTLGVTLAGVFLGEDGAGSAASGKKNGKRKVYEQDPSCEPVSFHTSGKNDDHLRSSKNIRLVRTTVMIAALCMILAGVMNGGARDVLIKAVNLCTECVGLG